MNEKPGQSKAFGAFVTAQDTRNCLLAEAVICIVPLWSCWQVHLHSTLSWLEIILIFWILIQLDALLVLKVLRTLWPFRPGRYYFDQPTPMLRAWVVASFIYNTNLGLFYNFPNLLPSPLRTLFYRALGANLGKSGVMIFGRISDPNMVTIEDGAVIGADTWLLPHALTRFDGRSVLLLGEIRVERDAIVGASCVVMPNVTIGPRASVRVRSYVHLGTNVPEGQTWAGNPAQFSPGRAHR